MAEDRKVGGWLIKVEWDYVPPHCSKFPVSYFWAPDAFKLAATIAKWTCTDCWVQISKTSYGSREGWSKQRILTNRYSVEWVEL